VPLALWQCHALVSRGGRRVVQCLIHSVRCWHTLSPDRRAMSSGRARQGKRGFPALVDTGASTVTCRPRAGEAGAAEQANRRVGMLPMGNGLRQGKAQPCDIANSCVSNICHTAPGDERPPCAETVCGIVYQQNFTRRKVNKFKCFSKHTSPPASPYHLCYDERTQEHGGSAPGREDTGWTLSRSWIRS
jgi:hypothetical protein